MTVQEYVAESARKKQISQEFERMKAAGRVPGNLSLDMYMKVDARVRNPRSSAVPVPQDYRSAKDLKLEAAMFEGMEARQDSNVYHMRLEARDRDIRWQRERPEYERRLLEADVINDRCEAAVKKVTASDADKARMAKGELSQAYKELYEIALTGHLRGVSEEILGVQAETCKNYEYHFKASGTKPQPGCEYLSLKKFEQARLAKGGSQGVPARPQRPVQKRSLSDVQVQQKAEPSSGVQMDGV